MTPGATFASILGQAVLGHMMLAFVPPTSVRIGGAADQPPSYAAAESIPWPFDHWREPETRRAEGGAVARARAGGIVAARLARSKRATEGGGAAVASAGGDVKTWTRLHELRRQDEEIIMALETGLDLP